MKHLFIPYPLALKAKELGFNDRCMAFYENTSPDQNNITISLTPVQWEGESRLLHEECNAPIYQQIIDWLREEKRIVVYPEYVDCNSRPTWVIKWHNGLCHNEMRIYNDKNKAIEEAFKLI